MFQNRSFGKKRFTNCNEIPLFLMQENVAIFFKALRNCNVSRKMVEKKYIKLSNIFVYKDNQDFSLGHI